jgi:hypothetical protein
MKVTGQEYLLGAAEGTSDIDSLMRYSLSLPVTTAVIGMPHKEMLDHNIQVARNFTAFPESDMNRLRKALGPSRDGLEKNLLGHHDGPTSKPQLFWV